MKVCDKKDTQILLTIIVKSTIGMRTIIIVKIEAVTVNFLTLTLNFSED